MRMIVKSTMKGNSYNFCLGLAGKPYILYNLEKKSTNILKGVFQMAHKGTMTLRMEPELKAQAAELFKALGMDLSTATGIFYRQALRCHGLPFEVNTDEECEPNEITYAAMEAAEKGDDLQGPFESVDELMAALNA